MIMLPSIHHLLLVLLHGLQQVDWKFFVNSQWDDQTEVIILSETVADNGVVGMLSGMLVKPLTGNAVENDIMINDFKLFNSADIEQDLTKLTRIKILPCKVT